MPVLKNWQEEKQSAWLYRKIAAREMDITRKKLFYDLADGADKQAFIWEEKIKTADQAKPLVYRPDFRTRVVGILIKTVGAESMRYILSAMKVRGMSIYSAPFAASSHSAATHLESRHKGLNTAGNFRAAVFGVNDGLVSNMSLVLGVLGANASHHMILLSGIAGLLAGACSMAAGEYVSMRSQREFFEYQIALEKEELELYPEEEMAELMHIYRARGIPLDEAKKMAELVINDPSRALDTLAREELGLNPNDLGSPVGAAVASFLAFATGAFIPLVPLFFHAGHVALFYSIGLTGIALFLIGGMLSLFTSRNALWSGLRMLLIGATAGGLTFLIGKLIGTVWQ
ncbi:MAG TPA: VIT1/CCC1 transporter family protein [Gammaproteobacteria bacterium]|nr:VIT1/CCC1 transporter family protein [Gammaproteobacteria bacterium]